MKPSSVLVSFTAAVCIIVTLLTSSSIAQSGPAGNGNTSRVYPAPTNLKVLPKNLTGAQVHAIMHQWEDQLGADCSTCHIRDPKKLGPSGRPQFDYADDSKPEKQVARVMSSMVDDINVNYIGKVENSGMPVTCGTCHRGRVNPEPFVAGDRAN